MSTDTSLSDNGPLTDEELQLLQRVKRSRVWRLIMDALALERERLFSGDTAIQGLGANGNIATPEQLWKSHGAILLVQHLLQNGPLFVVWYQRYMDHQEAQRDATKIRAGMDAHGERTYAPGTEAKDGLHEPPEFDL